MTDTVIEPARKADMGDCARILMDIYNNNVLNEGWTIKSATTLCEYHFAHQPDLFFVVKRAGEIVGFTFSYIKPWADGNHLCVEEIAVEKSARAGGTAQELVTELVRVAMNKYQIAKVDGTTFEDETGMPFKIYKWLGFTRVDDLFLVECDAQKLATKLGIDNTNRA